MFETGDEVRSVLALASDLAGCGPGLDDPGRVDLLRALEVLKAAASAAQARVTADLDRSQRAEQTAAGVPSAERGRGVAAQVALARRDSPHRGARHLGLATALVHEMPCTLAALEAGRISEWRATVLVRETAVLTRTDREAVDRELAGGAEALDRLEQLGDRALAARAKEVAYRLDAQSVVARARRAETERRVSVRPAPDTMAYLTALLPARQAIAVQVALGRAAEVARCAGDGRGRGQLMADTLVSALTGVPGAAPAPRPDDVAVRLVMTDRTLLDGSREPARLDGYGPVPAAWARQLVATSLDRGARVFVTRLLTDRAGALAAMESRARLAPAGLAALVRAREDGTCRTPWCDAPVRHVDHVVPHAAGGATTAINSQGLCVACNLAKEAPGWRAEVQSAEVQSAEVQSAEVQRAGPSAAPRTGRPGHTVVGVFDSAGAGDAGGAGDGWPRDAPNLATHTVVTTTPTGHTYRSAAPPLPGEGPPPDRAPSTETPPRSQGDGAGGTVPDPSPGSGSGSGSPPESVVEHDLRRRLGLVA